jgi:hypothetical protein
MPRRALPIDSSVGVADPSTTTAPSISPRAIAISRAW